MTDEELIARLRDACRGGEACKCSLNEAADRIEALHVKLSLAVDALRFIRDDPLDDLHGYARGALAEIGGEA